MKVYVVLACLDREEECDRHIYGVYETFEKAIDYAIEIGRKAFDECGVNPKYRECIILDENERKNYAKGLIAWLMDNENYMVEVYIYEMEVR